MKVFILTGEVGSGKTTQLLKWCAENNCAGVLSPVFDGKRFFREIESGQLMEMEAALTEDAVYEVGKYRFSKSAFEWAGSVINKALNAEVNYIIIDEVGPLELRGEGFHDVFRMALQSKKTIVTVVRSGKIDEVLKYFGILNYFIVENVNNITL